MKRRKNSGKCPGYLAFVRCLPCWVCYEEFWVWLLTQPADVQDSLLEIADDLSWLEIAYKSSGYSGYPIQSTPTEAAHIGLSSTRRGLGQKVPDSEAGPLCADHHRLSRDSHHAGTKAFWEKHPKLNRDGLLNMSWRSYTSGGSE